MRCRLQTKEVVFLLTCVLCDSDVENCWHVFVTCLFARQCWVAANLLDKIDLFVGTCECFNDWFFQLGGNLNEENRGKIFMVIWGIWNWRNVQLWKGEHIPSTKVVLLAMNKLFNRLHARHQDQSSPPASFVDNSVWQRPPTIMLKCNINGGHFPK